MEPKNLLTAFFLSLLVLNLSVFAQQANDPYSMEYGIETVDSVNLHIKGNGYVQVTKKITTSKEASGVVLPCPVQELEVKQDEMVLSHTLNEVDGKKLVRFEAGKGNQVTISYQTAHLITKEGVNWTMDYSTSADPQHTLINVHFQPETRVLPLPGDLLFSPMENGLIVYPDEEVFSFSVDYKAPQQKDPIDPGVDSMNLLLILGAIIVLVVSGFILLRRKDEKREEEKDQGYEQERGPEEDIEPVEKDTNVMGSVKKTLDDRELEIFELLENSEEEITQAYIYKSTGIPKSSLSEIMNRLERRNIIEKRREGRTNWIRFKEWIKE